jgi:hypothetical protein
VLANWLARHLAMNDRDKLWAVYANAALRPLIQDQIERAWRDLPGSGPVPMHRVEVMHLLHVLEMLEHEARVRPRPKQDPYDYELRARPLLNKELKPRCDALFIDEAQDFGEGPLALLSRLVVPRGGSDDAARSVYIFYDNAQNLYHRGTPVWSKLGLDMRGRSTVMKESFRSTQPVTEYALNVLYRLSPPHTDADHRELVERNLIERVKRNNRDWWRVRFNQVHGPAPEWLKFRTRKDELKVVADRVASWITKEGVKPQHIRIVTFLPEIRSELKRLLAEQKVFADNVARGQFNPKADTVVITTPHSMKGHESEIVVVPAADTFVKISSPGAPAPPEPQMLYVAMTRARSLLLVTGTDVGGASAAAIVSTLQSAREDLGSPPADEPVCSPVEEELAILEKIGSEHREWYQAIVREYGIETGPITRSDGSIAAEPLFAWREGSTVRACFGERPSEFVLRELEELGVMPVAPSAEAVATMGQT